MRLTEAKLLLLLKNVDKMQRYPTRIASKLNQEFSWVSRVLREMRAKGWVTTGRIGSKTFYRITDLAPMSEAIDELGRN